MQCNISDAFIHSLIFIQFHHSTKRPNRPVRYRISHNTQYRILIHKFNTYIWIIVKY